MTDVQAKPSAKGWLKIAAGVVAGVIIAFPLGVVVGDQGEPEVKESLPEPCAVLIGAHQERAKIMGEAFGAASEYPRIIGELAGAAYERKTAELTRLAAQTQMANDDLEDISGRFNATTDTFNKAVRECEEFVD